MKAVLGGRGLPSQPPLHHSREEREWSPSPFGGGLRQTRFDLVVEAADAGLQGA